MVECIRRWTGRHPVTLYGWEGTRQLCEHQKLEGIHHVNWSAARWQFLGKGGLFAAQTWIGCREARRVNFSKDRSPLIVSSSDFLPDSLPALEWKRRRPDIPWVAAFYLFAPPLADFMSGKPGPGGLFTMYRPVQQWYLRRMLKHADMILVTGEEDRERMMALGRSPDSVFAVRGGVDLTIPRSVPEPSEKRYDAVFIGRFHPQKGVRELLEIWKRVVAEKPDARLAMIGLGVLEGELREMRKQMRLEDRVDFPGFLDGVEKYRVIKASRVVVHPAIYDSGGMAAAEALVCGLPGVAFDLLSLKTYYPKGFLKAREGDLGEFAGNILRLLNDADRYASLSAEARAAGAEWDWDVRAQQILDAISQRLRGLGMTWSQGGAS